MYPRWNTATILNLTGREAHGARTWKNMSCRSRSQKNGCLRTVEAAGRSAGSCWIIALIRSRDTTFSAKRKVTCVTHQREHASHRTSSKLSSLDGRSLSLSYEVTIFLQEIPNKTRAKSQGQCHVTIMAADDQQRVSQQTHCATAFSSPLLPSLSSLKSAFMMLDCRLRESPNGCFPPEST